MANIRRAAARRLVFLCFVSLTACRVGAGDVDDGRRSSADVQTSQLSGSWFGTFHDIDLKDLEFVVRDDRISGYKVDGTAYPDVTGRITKAPEGARVFRFALYAQGKPATYGLFMADPGGAHLTYVDNYLRGAVLQKGMRPTTAPGYALADLTRSFTGDHLASKASSTGEKFATLEIAPVHGSCVRDWWGNLWRIRHPATAACTWSLGNGVSRKLIGVHPTLKGKYRMDRYADTPPASDAKPDGELLMTADKKFASGFTCRHDTLDPSDCDIYALY